MIRYMHVVSHLILMIYFAGAFNVTLPPSLGVKIVGSKLQWTPIDDVLYTVQYKLGSEPVDDWHSVLSHNVSTFEITKEFYGAIFRVRAETKDNASKWEISKPVECIHLHFCIPLMNVTVKPGKAYLSMAHKDQSLVKEYGNHLAFNISSWKVVTGGHSEVHFTVTNSRNEVFRNLESGETYCFQVQYSLLEKPYGNTSEKQCEIIPETTEEARRRTLLTTVLTMLCILTLCGCSIFFLFKNHKKYKQFLRPPVEIPRHFREFLSQEFSQQPSPSPSIQSLPSCDVIILIDNANLEENGQERRS